jgi:hypothetical protein
MTVPVTVSMIVFVATVAALAAVLLPGSAKAQEGQRAGLVVVYGDGRIERQCVTFAGESISGYELLQAAGLALSVEAGAIGPTVCSISGEGCSYPQESCFCRCQGSPCVYWSYWRMGEEGGWRYQVLGAGNTRVRNGDVEGWSWAAGTTRDAEEPPAVSFAEVCGETESLAEDAHATALETTLEEGLTASSTASSAANSAANSAEGSAQNTAQPTAAATVQSNAPALSLPAQPMWLLLGAVTLLPAALLVGWALWRKGR